MAEPLFPINRRRQEIPGGVLVLEPYSINGAWVFDDLAAGLEGEPFVGDNKQMIDRLVVGIPRADTGFRLLFSHMPFDGQQMSLTWVRADPVEGNWYRADATGEEGWLCPALFCYFPEPPEQIFVRAEPKE
jgi:hypothetical protein